MTHCGAHTPGFTEYMTEFIRAGQNIMQLSASNRSIVPNYLMDKNVWIIKIMFYIHTNSTEIEANLTIFLFTDLSFWYFLIMSVHKNEVFPNTVIGCFIKPSFFPCSLWPLGDMDIVRGERMHG